MTTLRAVLVTALVALNGCMTSARRNPLPPTVLIVTKPSERQPGERRFKSIGVDAEGFDTAVYFNRPFKPGDRITYLPFREDDDPTPLGYIQKVEEFK